MSVIIVNSMLLSSEQIAAIKSAQLLVFPTDTVPGICARVDDEVGIEKIFQLKRRDKNKSLLLMLPNLSYLSIYFELTARDVSLVERHSPGQVTFVVKAKEALSLPEQLCKYHEDIRYLGFRVPLHALAQEILSITGPLAQTSLNISGDEPIRNSEDIPFKSSVDFIFPFENQAQLPSTIVRLVNDNVEVLREGVIPVAQIK